MKKKIYGLLIALMMFPSFSFASNPKKATVINPDTGHRKEVFVGSKTAFDDGYVLEVAFGYKELPEGLVGFSAITDYSKFLSQNITAAATTLPVTSMETTDGHTITMADLGSKVFLTIEPQSTLKKELVMCTGISGLSFTGCTRGLAFYGTSTAAVAINAKTHNSGSTVTISNVHYVYEELVDKDSDQTLSGDITFSGDVDFANIPTSTTTLPTENNELASKLYVDTVGAGGVTALNASTTMGIIINPETPNTIGVKASSAGGLNFSSDGYLQVKASSTAGIGVNSNGLYLDGSDPVEFSSTTTVSGFLGWLHFGQGTDGDVILTSDATSTRDMYYRNLTINAGVTLNPNGYRIYVSDTLRGPGKIARNGNNGSAGGVCGAYSSFGAGGAGGAGLSSGSIFGSLSGGTGGNGGVYNNDYATVGTAGISAISITGVNGSAGGAGAAGTYAAKAGGVGGTSTLENCALSLSYPYKFFTLNATNETDDLLYYVAVGTSSGSLLSGSSGSGGGGGGSGNNGGNVAGGGGGGAGSNGGVIFVAARHVLDPAFEAKGGNGGNGAGSGTYNCPNGGGGAGGAGGLIILVYQTRDTETVTTSGGTGGTGGGGSYPGAAGNNGNAGKYIKIRIP